MYVFPVLVCMCICVAWTVDYCSLPHRIFESMLASGGTCDMGYASIFVDPVDKPNQLFFDSTGKMIGKANGVALFNFVGRVTKIATSTCMPLANVWGRQYYVDGSSFSSIYSEICCPAWCVQKTPNQEERIF